MSCNSYVLCEHIKDLGNISIEAWIHKWLYHCLRAEIRDYLVCLHYVLCTQTKFCFFAEYRCNPIRLHQKTNFFLLKIRENPFFVNITGNKNKNNGRLQETEADLSDVLIWGRLDLQDCKGRRLFKNSKVCNSNLKSR